MIHHRVNSVHHVILLEDHRNLIDYDFFQRKHFVREDVLQWLDLHCTQPPYGPTKDTRGYHLFQLHHTEMDDPDSRASGYGVLIAFTEGDHAAMFKLTFG